MIKNKSCRVQDSRCMVFLAFTMQHATTAWNCKDLPAGRQGSTEEPGVT